MTIKILLADDHQITREGLGLLIARQSDMEVVGHADDGRQAVALVAELNPDVVVMDVSMPNLNGMQATRQIVKEFPEVKIIALSMHSDQMFIIEMIKSGANGYLLKDCAFEELGRAIHDVVEGNIYLSPAISGAVIDDYLQNLTMDKTAKSHVLTDREREILQLIAEGVSTKKIALKLHISTKTVETHRRQIMNKLDIYSLPELTKYAVRKGLTSLEP